MKPISIFVLASALFSSALFADATTAWSCYAYCRTYTSTGTTLENDLYPEVTSYGSDSVKAWTALKANCKTVVTADPKLQGGELYTRRTFQSSEATLLNSCIKN